MLSFFSICLSYYLKITYKRQNIPIGIWPRFWQVHKIIHSVEKKTNNNIVLTFGLPKRGLHLVRQVFELDIHLASETKDDPPSTCEFFFCIFVCALGIRTIFKKNVTKTCSEKYATDISVVGLIANKYWYIII